MNEERLGHQEVYGEATVGTLARVRSKALRREDVLDYDPMDYCLPFTLRLSLKLEDLGMFPEDCPDEEALRGFILRRAQERGISIRGGWFDGKSDPGEFRDSDSTRMNLYAVCAALDADYEQTGEIFRKVFFKCPFLPKRRQELIFAYYAGRAMARGEGGSGWYEKGLELERCLGESGGGTKPPIAETGYIYSAIEDLDEAGFERFLRENAASFTINDPLNEFVTARKLIRALSQAGWQQLCREKAGEKELRGEFINQYDSLIDGILGFRQRDKSAPAGLSDLDLPKQLLSCFPSGKILGDILGRSGGAKEGDANALVSLDELSKMAALLIFYVYFSGSGKVKSEVKFKGFVATANRELTKYGLDYLYPGQPYGSFILCHAAAEDPVASLREYLRAALNRSAEDKLIRQIKDCAPDCDEALCRELVRRCGAVGFHCRLCAWLLATGQLRPKELCRALPEKAMELDPEHEQERDALLRVFDGLPEEGRDLSAALGLLPVSGLSRELLSAVLPGLTENALEMLLRAGLVTEKKKGLVSVSAELRGFARELSVDQSGLRRAILERAAALAEDGDAAKRHAPELASVLETLAPKAERARRGGLFMKAAELYALDDKDEKRRAKAAECARRGREYTEKLTQGK